MMMPMEIDREDGDEPAPPPARQPVPAPVARAPQPAPLRLGRRNGGAANAGTSSLLWGDTVWNPEQARALQLMADRRNVFVTGPGGAGKSKLLWGMQRWAQSRELTFAVTATTGKAALNVQGITLHSWAGIGLGSEPAETLVAKIRGSVKRSRRGTAFARWTKTSILFVDEVSMLSSELFTKLDTIGRQLRNRARVPWGGIQLVLFGDFCQLPPVEKEVLDIDDRRCYINPERCDKGFASGGGGGGGDQKVREDHGRSANDHVLDAKEKEKAIEDARLARKYLILCPAWKKAVHAVVLLKQIYRQTDPVFVDLLGRARFGTLTAADYKILTLRHQITIAAAKEGNSFVRDRNGLIAPCLHPYKKDVEAENLNALLQLPGNYLRVNRRTSYMSVRTATGGVTANVTVEEDVENGDTEVQRAAEKLANNISAPEPFLFKVGAVVMLLVNLNVRQRLVNGLRGIVVGIGGQHPPQRPFPSGDTKEESPGNLSCDVNVHVLTAEEEQRIWVLFEGQNEPIAVQRYAWKQCLNDSQRHLSEDAWTEWVQISQVPLMLAYSSTIHKTQSLTLTAGCLNLGDEVRTAGQGYTALSRIESLDGVFISKLSPKAFKTDPVFKYYYDLLAESTTTTSGVAASAESDSSFPTVCAAPSAKPAPQMALDRE
jgi:hypothetical protein